MNPKICAFVVSETEKKRKRQRLENIVLGPRGSD